MPDAPHAEATEPVGADSGAGREPGTQITHRPAGLMSKLPPWSTLATMIVALVAVVLAGVAWLRVGQSTDFSDQQVKEAKKDLCAASLTVRQAVGKNTHQKNPVQDDPIGKLAVAANAQLSLSASSAHLQRRLQADVAAPADVTDAVDGLATTLDQLGMTYLSGKPKAVRDQLRKDLDSQIAELGKLCE